MSLNSVDACRGGYPCDVDGLKEAAHCGTYHGPRGSQVQAIATAVNVKPRTLSDQLNPGEPDYPTAKTLETVAVMTADHPVVSRYFAKLQGCLVYRVPTGGTFAKTTANSIREFGEFLQEIAGQGELLTPAKLRRVQKEGEDAIVAIKAALDHFEQLAAAARGGKR